MSDSKLPGCFKYGCIGCLSIVALFLGLTFLLGALQFVAETEPQPEQRLAEQELPAPPSLPVIDPDQPETVEFDPLPALASGQGVGTLVVDLRMGEFTIEPGPPDQPIRVEADFDAGKFELREEWNQGLEGNWTYQVDFGAKGGFWGLLTRGGGEVRNNVTITVPRGHPMRIVGTIKMGESKVDLGGLWLDSFDVELGMGDHFVEIREPLAMPMESFIVDSSMGEIELRNIGNGSPRRVEVDHGMGDFLLDLQGDWRRDAEVDASFSMGSCRIWVPEEAFVELSGGSVAMGEARTELPDTSSLPEDAPRLAIDVGGNMGELVVEY